MAWHAKTSAETTASIAPVQANATVVEAALVQTRDLDSTISAVGSLRAKESVTLSSEIGGRVDKILFQEGQRVDAGTLLFQLDTSILNASVQSARAANILAQSTFERTEALSKRGISATQALEEAQANLRNTEAALALAEAQLAQTSIKAPFDGVVGLRSVSVGAYVTAGTTNLAKLDQIDPLVAEFTLPEVALANISPQQNVSVVADALPDQPFQGQVYAIEPSVDETGRSIRMRALIANPDLKLRPGLLCASMSRQAPRQMPCWCRKAPLCRVAKRRPSIASIRTIRSRWSRSRSGNGLKGWSRLSRASIRRHVS
ncbi:efflux RND transporter periplasmic adaptor subunit [Ochrobactrum haematophilum]|uniref:Efflux RND transporter periplasmic adaptor subunit n=1 Tax=Brucella haematophila TaxID=419474 RepID=A0ABX1DTJ6_9HYPH|nr:efflux RND transporter periplasmic adaptor subunit [Brucella haematophila]